MTTRSQRILAASEGPLAASGAVRFIRESTDGTLGQAEFAAYLAIEERFVRTAARIAGLSLWLQPDWTIAERHATAVADLVGEQLDYFRGIRSRWPADEATATRAIDRSSALSTYALTTAEAGGYWAAITCMFAAESLYSRWCATAAATPVTRSPDLDAWITLHTEPAFLRQVELLRMLLDSMPADIPDATVTDWFDGMLGAEDSFHNAVYQPSVQDNEFQDNA